MTLQALPQQFDERMWRTQLDAWRRALVAAQETIAEQQQEIDDLKSRVTALEPP